MKKKFCSSKFMNGDHFPKDLSNVDEDGFCEECGQYFDPNGEPRDLLPGHKAWEPASLRHEGQQ